MLGLIRRKRFDELKEKLVLAEAARKSAERSAANAGHARDIALTEVGKLAANLRLIKISLSYKTNINKLKMEIELADAILLDGFRYGTAGDYFQTAISYYVKEMFYSSPMGTSFLTGKRLSIDSRVDSL